MSNSSTGDYKDTQFAKELITQLHKIPTLRAFEQVTERLLFRSLYFALSDHHRFFRHILPKEDLFEIYPRTWDDVNDTCYNKTYYRGQVSRKSKGHLGHICSATIPAGQFAYNCYDCGVDATCCLCEDCFNKEEHSDHNVNVHKSSGDAICDCGDESSWKVTLDCELNNAEKKHKESLPPLPEDLKSNISILVKVLFDFILDVNVTNMSALPTLKFRNMPSTSDTSFDQRQDFLERIGSIKNLPESKVDKEIYSKIYKPEEDGDDIDEVFFTGTFSEYYCLVIWNDEFHNFDQARDFLSIAFTDSDNQFDDNYPWYEVAYDSFTDFDSRGDRLTELAKVIDKKGYLLYARSRDKTILEDKIKQFKKSSKVNGLTYSLITADEYMQITFCRSILLWFQVILENDNTLLTDYIKQEISKTLFEPANFHLKNIPLFAELVEQPFLLNENLQIPVYKNYTSQNPNDSTPVNKLRINSTFENSKVEYFENASRLQYLLFFEMRYPKSMRKLIKETIIPIVTNTTETRFNFAKQVLTLLPTYELNTAKYDREWHLSILETFRLQVYHDPNAGTNLLKLGLLENVIDSIINLFSSSRSLRNGKYFIVVNASWETRRTAKVLSQAIEGFNVLIKFIHEGYDQLFTDSFIAKILLLFTIFDEIYKLKRKTGSHVEYQDHTTCALYHASVIPIYSIAQNLARICYGFESPNKNVEKSIVLISNYLKSKPRHFTSKKIVKFDITTDGVTMAHPIGALLSGLSRGYKFFDPSLYLKSISDLGHDINGNTFFEISSENTVGNFLAVADEMLQPWVFHAQISSNFWIRNGVYASFANTFFDAYKTENYIYIMQQSIILNEFPLDDIIDRYMLTSCINGDTDFESTVYEEKISMILTEFMSLMYYILTFREYYDSSISFDDCTNLSNESMIASVLAPAPLKYSELKDSSPWCDNFDEILENITTYVPPSSINDYGHYTLTTEYWNKIDPFSFFRGKISPSEVEEGIIKNLAIIKNKNPDEIVVTPYFHPLSKEDADKFKKVGEFMKSTEFVKLLYKVLRFAVTSDNDSHLNITLHLIHAIILDDDLYNKGDSHGLKNFVELPICNLLLNAAEKSDIPKYISKKASTVLEILLLKDDDVLTSLMDCFGENHMEKYKKSKHGKTLETKLQRKKRLALKRQKKVLQKMMKQQSAFVEQNKTFFDDGNSTAGRDEHQSFATNSMEQSVNQIDEEVRNCILCKNPENHNSLFGVPGFISTSSIFWTIPTIDDKPPEFLVDEFSRIKNPYPNKDGKSSCTREKLVINGCPHGMHYTCFQNMLKEKKLETSNFSCPLCKGRFNVFIPSFKLREVEVDPSRFDTVSYNDPNKIYNSVFGENVSLLTVQIFEKPLFHVLSNPFKKEFLAIMLQLDSLNESNVYLKKCIPPYKKSYNFFYENLRREYYSQFSMPLLMASTLEMQEIATREKNIVVIPEILGLLLKSLLQYRILDNYKDIDTEREKARYFKFLLHNPYLGFLETLLVLYTESDVPLIDCVKFSLMKKIVFTALSIIQRYYVNPRNLNFDSLLDDNIPTLNESSTVYHSLFAIVNGVLEQFGNFNDDNYFIEPIFIRKLYQVICTNIKNYERQLQYVSLLLNTLPVENGENLMPTIDNFLTEALEDNSTTSQFMGILIDNIKLGLLEKTMPKCHKRDEKIDTIDYPKCVKFIDLPEKLKNIAVTGFSKTKSVVVPDEYYFDGEPVVSKVKCKHICLNCGKWLIKIEGHNKKCKMGGYSSLYFTPLKNNLQMSMSHLITMKTFKIESPYLNKHGEPAKGLVGLGDSGTLNIERYKHLQDTWFNQTLIGNQIRDGRDMFYIPMRSYATNENYIAGILEPTVDVPISTIPPDGSLSELFDNFEFRNMMWNPEGGFEVMMDNENAEVMMDNGNDDSEDFGSEDDEEFVTLGLDRNDTVFGGGDDEENDSDEGSEIGVDNNNDNPNNIFAYDSDGNSPVRMTPAFLPSVHLGDIGLDYNSEEDEDYVNSENEGSYSRNGIFEDDDDYEDDDENYSEDYDENDSEGSSPGHFVEDYDYNSEDDENYVSGDDPQFSNSSDEYHYDLDDDEGFIW